MKEDKVSALLDFEFSSEFLKILGEATPDPSRVLEVNKNLKSLDKLTKKIGESEYKLGNADDIPKIFREFKESLKKGNYSKVFSDKKKLRYLTYSLSYSDHKYVSIISEKKQFDVVLILVSKYWRDTHLYGLFDCLLRNWDKSYDSIEELRKFVSRKIKDYQYNRSLILRIRKNIQFFQKKNGAVNLGQHLALKNRKLTEITSFFDLPNGWITYPYFSRAIVAYIQKTTKDLSTIYQDIHNVLIEHDQIATSKRVISQMILQADKPQFAHMQNDIKKIAFEKIGDPTHLSSWAPYEDATTSDKDDLDKARDTLNQWITKEFISVFFERCINDVKRKKFWLKIADQITSFKVIGPANTKQLLKQDDRIRTYVDSRFKITGSSKQVSAFLMYVKDYVLIEFSDPGYAFYAYRTGSQYMPKVNGYFQSVDELRDGSMPMLVYRKGFTFTDSNAEGRLIHNDGDMKWETTFSFWLKKYVNINV